MFSKLDFSTIACIAIKTLGYVFLNILQFNEQFKPNPLPSKLSEEDHKLFTAYEKDKKKFMIVRYFFDFYKEFLMFFYLTRIYSYCASMKIFDTDVLMILAVVSLGMIGDQPFQLYYDFVIEKKFNFNEKTLFIFVKDFFATLMIVISLSYPLLKLLFFLIKRFENFYIIVALCMLLFQLVMLVLYPKVIAPLFNKFTIMTEEHEIYDDVLKLSKKLGYSISKIYVVDGSKRSGHSNAYFTGFGSTKQIVFYDTIFKHLNKNEIMAVLCHEFGHFLHGHLFKQIAMSFIHTAFIMFLFNKITLYLSEFPLSIRLLYFINFISLFDIIIMSFHNYFIRQFEKQADKYAVDFNYGPELKSALWSLSQKNKSTLLTNWLYGIVKLTHPVVSERIEYIDSLLAKKE